MDIEQLLMRQSFFEYMEPAHLRTVSGCAGERDFNPGELILREGDYASTFYLIREGSVSLETHVAGSGSITIQTLGPGDILGWSWLFPPYRWHFDARVLTPTSTLEFNGACLRQQCDDDPALGYDIMKRVAQTIIERLQASRLQLMGITEYAPR